MSYKNHYSSLFKYLLFLFNLLLSILFFHSQFLSHTKFITINKFSYHPISFFAFYFYFLLIFLILHFLFLHLLHFLLFLLFL
jgi:hypothetical protein